MMASVSVLIVNFGTPELTIVAARSALAEPLVRDVVITNNPAPDEHVSLSALRRFATETPEVDVVELDVNRGFGAGVNAAAAVARAPYLFLLNSDAKLQEGGLAPVVSMLESDPGAGLGAPPVYRDDGFSPQPDVCGRFPTPLRLLTRSSTADCTSDRPDWLSGVALLVRRNDFTEIGGFDENIFLYYEDIELCHRFRTNLEKGCRRLVDGPGVVHLGGASFRSRRGQKVHYYAAQDYYLKKAGYSSAGRLLVRAARALYAPLTLVRGSSPPDRSRAL